MSQTISQFPAAGTVSVNDEFLLTQASTGPGTGVTRRTNIGQIGTTIVGQLSVSSVAGKTGAVTLYAADIINFDTAVTSVSLALNDTGTQSVEGSVLYTGTLETKGQLFVGSNGFYSWENGAQFQNVGLQSAIYLGGTITENGFLQFLLISDSASAHNQAINGWELLHQYNQGASGTRTALSAQLQINWNNSVDTFNQHTAFQPFIEGGGPSSSIASGIYNSITGLVTLALTQSIGTNPGDSINISNATGTGAFSSINGLQTAGSGSTGTTLTFTVATGLTMTITGGTALAGVPASLDVALFCMNGAVAANAPGYTSLIWLEADIAAQFPVANVIGLNVEFQSIHKYQGSQIDAAILVTVDYPGVPVKNIISVGSIPIQGKGSPINANTIFAKIWTNSSGGVQQSGTIGTVIDCSPGYLTIANYLINANGTTIDGLGNASFKSVAQSCGTIAAAGTSQVTATAITAQDVVVTSGMGGVRLVNFNNGCECVIRNRVGNTITVYPQTSAQIETAGINVGLTLPSGTTGRFCPFSATQWYY